MFRNLKLLTFTLIFLNGNFVLANESCEKWLTSDYFSIATATSVKSCLNLGTNVNGRNNKGQTPLHLAAENARDSTIILELLSAGANPSLTDANGWRPLHVAAALGNSPMKLIYV